MREKIFKKGMKGKLLSVMLSLVIMLSLLPINSMKVFAADASGDFGVGNALHWELAAGILTISGSGNMPNYTMSSDAPWASYAGSITKLVISEGVTSVGKNSFGYTVSPSTRYDALISVELPNTITEIGDEAFYYSGLKSIVIPDSVTTVGQQVFCYCQSLVSAVVPGSITSMDGSVFSDCSNLTSIELKDGLTQIGSYFLSACTKLTSVVIPSSVTTIGDNAFRGCTALTSVTFEGTVGSNGSGITEGDWLNAFDGVGTSGTDKTTLNLPASGLTGPANNRTKWKGGYFKTVYAIAHTHDWKYSATNNKLEAYCENDGCDHYAASYTAATTNNKLVSLTLSASSENYSGSAATITVGTSAERSAWTGAGLTIPTVSYTKADGTGLAAAPTAVGSYFAKVSPAGVTATAANTAKVSFTIEQAHEQGTVYAFNDSNHWFTCIRSDCTNAAHKYAQTTHTYDQPDHKCVCGKVDPTYGIYESIAPNTGVIRDITKDQEAVNEDVSYQPAIKSNSVAELKALFNVTDSQITTDGVNVWLELVDASVKIDALSKSKLDLAVDDNTVGLYLDASIFKKVGANPAQAVTTIGGGNKIKLSFVVPVGLRRAGRTFTILRYHAGDADAENIGGTYNAATGEFVFETDKFSYYALVYKDTVAPAAPGYYGGTPSTEPPKVSPKTGATSSAWLYMMMLLGASMIGLGVYKKKTSKR